MGPVEKGHNRHNIAVLIIYLKANGHLKSVINVLGRTVLLTGWSRKTVKLLRCLFIKLDSRRKAQELLMWNSKSTIIEIKMYWSCCNDWHTGTKINHLFKEHRCKNKGCEYFYIVISHSTKDLCFCLIFCISIPWLKPFGYMSTSTI